MTVTQLKGNEERYILSNTWILTKSALSFSIRNHMVIKYLISSAFSSQGRKKRVGEGERWRSLSCLKKSPSRPATTSVFLSTSAADWQNSKRSSKNCASSIPMTSNYTKTSNAWDKIHEVQIRWNIEVTFHNFSFLWQESLLATLMKEDVCTTMIPWTYPRRIRWSDLMEGTVVQQGYHYSPTTSSAPNGGCRLISSNFWANNYQNLQHEFRVSGRNRKMICKSH